MVYILVIPNVLKPAADAMAAQLSSHNYGESFTVPLRRNAMNLYRRSTGADYSSATIFEIAFVPELTAHEIDSALHFMA